MTIEITDEMRKVAGDAVHDHLYDKPAPDYASPTGDDFQDIGLAALTAALPIIEKQMRAALEAPIRELHKPVPMVPGLDDTPVCDGCENPGRFVPYPCPTIQALDEKGTRP